MLTSKQIEEIREHLENAKNPVFFFDNDPDGLCSFILLQKFTGRGRGVIIKSFPGLNASYFKRVEELNADYIFVLDKPVIDKDFIQMAKEKNIPLVMIDHHNVEKPDLEYYYNTYHNDNMNEPVAYLCYKIANKKEDMWLSLIGCITDGYIPDFIDEFKKQNKELADFEYKDSYDILYNTRLGEAAMVISFALKDRTSNVVSLIRFLIKARNAEDILEENSKTKIFRERYKEINQKFQRLMEKVEESIDGELIFFTYSGDLSISQYIANRLLYDYPHKVIVSVYKKGNISNISLRWEKDIRIVTLNAIKDIENATGGGHEHSCGARMPVDQLDKFKENLLREIEKVKKGN